MKRRDFLKTTGAAAITLPNIITSNALGANGVPPASERIVMAGIGMGRRALPVMSRFMQHKEIQCVAVCDVHKDKKVLAQEKVNKKYGNSDCKAYDDYREILARSDIDMLYCAPPDHWHAQITIEACKAGKDVMCEKPLTLTIGEGRKMVNAAQRYGRVVSGGSQRVLEDYGAAACVANSGKYGKILSASASPGPSPFPCYLGAQPVPEVLDWDFWLGPAPWVPYHPYRCGDSFNVHSKECWRSWEDYSGGGMTDWGGHKFGGLLHGLKLDHTGPSKIIPSTGRKDPIIFEFENGMTIRVEGPPIYHCEGGDVGRISTLNTKIPRDLRWYSSGAKTLIEDFLYCVKTRKRPFRDVEYSHRTASLCHLANITTKLNRTLHWDPVKEDFINDTEASRLVDRPRRGPWQI